METTNEIPGFWPVVWRGMMGHCPDCGKGKLFRSYLKPVESCAACGKNFGHIRADDGPAWLTIIVVGHIFALILPFAPDIGWSDRVLIGVWCSCAIMLTLLVLPRAKGMFIGIIWRMRCLGSEK